MDIVEPELGTVIPDGADTSRNRYDGSFKLLPWIDQSLRAVHLDESGDGLGDMELVRVGVGGLRLLELLHCPRAQLKVLLVKPRLYLTNEQTLAE